MLDFREQMARLIEQVLDHGMPVSVAQEEANRFPPEAQGDHDLTRAFHLLLHYGADEDIRLRDQQYADAQVCGLRQLVDQLRKRRESGWDSS